MEKEQYHLNRFCRLKAQPPSGSVPPQATSKSPSITHSKMSWVKNEHPITRKQGFPVQDGGSAEGTRVFRPDQGEKTQYNNLAL